MLAVAAPAGAAVAHDGHGRNDHGHGIRTQTTGHRSKPTSVSTGDAAFLVTATSAALTEIQAGQLAVAQGTSPAVTSYGQRLVTDHTKELGTLQWIGTATGVTLPTTPDADQQAELTTLGSTDAASFDRVFLTAAVNDHRAAVKLFTKEARSSRRGVARFALMELPMLRHHLRIAEFDLWFTSRPPMA
jgi:putative membrane protein